MRIEVIKFSQKVKNKNDASEQKQGKCTHGKHGKKKKERNTTHLQIFSIKIFPLFYNGISDLHFP